MDRREPFRLALPLPVVLAVALTAAAPAVADDEHVAAPGTPAVAAPDGSPDAPWPDLASAFAAGDVAPGDRLLLAPGEWGIQLLDGLDAGGAVTIEPAVPGTVHLDALKLIRGSSDLEIVGLSLWPRAPIDQALVETDANCDRIVLRDLDLRGTELAASYPGWSLDEWTDYEVSGVHLVGDDNELRNSTLTGLGFAVASRGARTVIAGNVIRGFSGDGIRAVGADATVVGNVIQDCVQIDENHADGIQSWSIGPETRRAGQGVLGGLTIQNNVILEWASDPVNPLKCSLQGIGLFDGMFENLRIENNVVVVTAYHGITVAGAMGATIRNNTLVNPVSPGAEEPWIRVAPHKDDRPSRDVTVTNNIAPRVSLVGVEGRVTEGGNLIVPYPARVLTAPYAGDWTPLAGSAPVDAALPGEATAADIHGRARAGAPDVGAVER